MYLCDFLFSRYSSILYYAPFYEEVCSDIIHACWFGHWHRSQGRTALAAKTYCVEKGFNTNYCFLIDFSIPSGKKRFFVWDFKGDSIKYSSLCAHGYGKESTPKKPVYSNVEGSYCSSLGKYKVGIRSYSKWGINVHYKLHGLESTNSNAFKRYIVLHSYTPVPTLEIYPMHLPLGISQGCPVICDDVMRKVDALLKAEKKPVLLWIYE